MDDPFTLIIVHGAFHQAAHFRLYKIAVQKTGIQTVLIPQLPSAGLSPPEDAFAKDVAVLEDTIKQAMSFGKPILFQAHSYGAIPLAEALGGIQKKSETSSMDGGSKIVGILFCAAIVPDAGESLAEAMKTGVAPWVKIEGDLCYVTNPTETFYNNLQPASVVFEAMHLIVPQATQAFLTPAMEANWSEYPCAYIKCLKDNSTSLADQDHMIEKMRNKEGAGKLGGKDVRVVELESDHCTMLSMPDRLVVEVIRFWEEVSS